MDNETGRWEAAEKALAVLSLSDGKRGARKRRRKRPTEAGAVMAQERRKSAAAGLCLSLIHI